jgi:hypothetical protein
MTTKPEKRCPRCAKSSRLATLCLSCQTDVALERSYGVTIPKEQWPIEFLANFIATADLAHLRGEG